jgi:deoxyadenosine/deoxycytidine kinase
MGATLLSIMGPIGVGKTTLARHIAEALHAEMIEEQYAENPFLAAGYTDRSELALPSQLFFLLSRAKQLSEAAWPTSGLVVTDYAFLQDRLFAEVTLPPEDLRRYHDLLERVAPTIHPPQLVVYLRASVTRLLERIHSRGRAFEATFTTEFLSAMADAHERNVSGLCCPVLSVDTDELDFRRQTDCRDLLTEIRRQLKTSKT